MAEQPQQPGPAEPPEQPRLAPYEPPEDQAPFVFLGGGWVPTSRVNVTALEAPEPPPDHLTPAVREIVEIIASRVCIHSHDKTVPCTDIECIATGIDAWLTQIYPPTK